jgi:hypothetical protein
MPAEGGSQRDASPQPPFRLWTRPQRGVLVAFVLIFSAVLLAKLAFNRAYVSEPQPARSARYDELADRIDPNVATWQELAVLPQIGESRAREIVDFREQSPSRRLGRPVFARLEDMMKVRGLGPNMLETLRPHLTFPPMPATAPAAYNPVSQPTERAP